MENIMTDGIITDGKLILNGKRYKLVLDEEQQVQRTGWERMNCGEEHHFIDMKFNSCWARDEYSHYTDGMYEAGNYTNNEKLSNNIGRAVSLYLRMLRWQAENDEPIVLNKLGITKWSIYYDAKCEELKVEWALGEYTNGHTVFFSTRLKAEECAEVFKDDLIWLHTQFYHRLDARGVCNEKV